MSRKRNLVVALDHQVAPAADGTWTDPGYTTTVPVSGCYSAKEIWVGVFNQSNKLVGIGSAKCVLVDGSVTPQG